MKLLLGAALWILLLLLTLFVLANGSAEHEQFADPSTIPSSASAGAIDNQCLDCASYFSGAVSLNFGITDTDSMKISKIADYANHQNTVITAVLAAVKGFVSGAPLAGVKCKTKPTEPSQAYYDCLREHVTYTASCDSTKMTQLQNSCPASNRNCSAYSDMLADCQLASRVIDDVIAKASICSVKDCNDIKIYPKALEQERCKETSICKTVEDLEANIIKIHDKMAESLAACTSKLTDSNSDCVKHFLDIIAAKEISGPAGIVRGSGTGAGLGSEVGMDNTTFDISSMVIGNTA